MIDLPQNTRIHKKIPKEAFYKNLRLSAALKEKFVSDVKQIFVEYSLTKERLNLVNDSDIKEILLLSISLKKKEFNDKIIEIIAKQNPHKLIFILQYQDEAQLAVYHKKLYRAQWMQKEKISLAAEGFSLEEIFVNFIEIIALNETTIKTSETKNNISIDEKLLLQEKTEKLKKQIEKTEKAAWKEIQPKKRFDLYQKLKNLKQELLNLGNI